ncbi:MAG: hypothetical protein ACHQFW_01365 [Chitinophagales bacterium]
MKILFHPIKSIYWLITAAIIFALFLICYTLNYETNDDPVMSYVMAGSFTGTGSEHVLFMNFMTTLLLKNLFTLAPAYNWYAGFFLIVHFLALIQISFIMSKRNNTLAMFIIFFALIFVMQGSLILKLQFTSTAFVAGIAGLLSLLNYLTNKLHWKYLFIPMGFFILSGIIRFECFIAIIIIGVPISTYIIYHQKLLKNVLPVFIILIIPCTLEISNTIYYNKTPETASALDCVKHSQKFVNHPYLVDEGILEQAGLSNNDYALSMAYFRADEKVFSCHNFSLLDEIASKDINYIKPFPILYHYVFTTLLFPLYFIIVVFFLILGERKKRFLIIFLFLFNLLLFYLLTVYFKLPLRVYHPFIYAFCMIICFIMFPSINAAAKKVKYIAIPCFTLIAIIIFMQLSINKNISNAAAKIQQEQNDAIAHVNAHPEILFMNVGNTDPFHKPAIFAKLPQFLHHNYFDGATFQDMPAFKQLLEINSLNNLTSDIRNKEVVFISNDTPFYDAYKIFMGEHYNIQVSFEEYKLLPTAKKMVRKIELD